MIEFESPPHLDPSIYSDEENSPIPSFPHRDSVFLTRLQGATALGNSASPEPQNNDDDNESIDEIDVLDLLQIKTPTSKTGMFSGKISPIIKIQLFNVYSNNQFYFNFLFSSFFFFEYF